MIIPYVSRYFILRKYEAEKPYAVTQMFTNTNGIDAVSTRPKVVTPIRLVLQIGEFLEYTNSRTSFQGSQ